MKFELKDLLTIISIIGTIVCIVIWINTFKVSTEYRLCILENKIIELNKEVNILQKQLNKKK